MGTWNAFYVRAHADNTTVTTAIREKFPNAEIESSAAFVGVRMSGDTFEPPPETDLAALSLTLETEVIWLAFQSAVDAFEFYHWRSGECLRALVYGFEEERTWERVEGRPEPWERDVLFDQRELEHAVKYAGSDSGREELRRIWRDAEIVPGRTEPGLSSRDCAHKIAAYYGFPHYR